MADYALKLGAMRPEFDVESGLRCRTRHRARGQPHARGDLRAARALLGGRAQAVRAARSSPARGRSRASTARSPRRVRCSSRPAAAANKLSGGSRAAQFMLLDQAITEVRQPKLLLANDERLLTPAGRSVLAGYLNGGGRDRVRRRPCRRHPPHHRPRPPRAPAGGDPRRRGGLARRPGAGRCRHPGGPRSPGRPARQLRLGRLNARERRAPAARRGQGRLQLR